jgi:hypothetical protein
MTTGISSSLVLLLRRERADELLVKRFLGDFIVPSFRQL